MVCKKYVFMIISYYEKELVHLIRAADIIYWCLFGFLINERMAYQ